MCVFKDVENEELRLALQLSMQDVGPKVCCMCACLGAETTTAAYMCVSARASVDRVVVAKHGRSCGCTRVCALHAHATRARARAHTHTCLALSVWWTAACASPAPGTRECGIGVPCMLSAPLHDRMFMHTLTDDAVASI